MIGKVAGLCVIGVTGKILQQALLAEISSERSIISWSKVWLFRFLDRVLIFLEISFKYLLKILRIIFGFDLITVCFTTLLIPSPLLPAPSILLFYSVYWGYPTAGCFLVSEALVHFVYVSLLSFCATFCVDSRKKFRLLHLLKPNVALCSSAPNECKTVNKSSHITNTGLEMLNKCAVSMPNPAVAD